MRSFVVSFFGCALVAAAAACGDGSGADNASRSGANSATSGNVTSGPTRCTTDDQCEGKCVAGTCAAPTVTDGKVSLYLGETDVDCGGRAAPPCAETKGCATDADCTTKICGLSKK